MVTKIASFEYHPAGRLTGAYIEPGDHVTLRGSLCEIVRTEDRSSFGWRTLDVADVVEGEYVKRGVHDKMTYDVWERVRVS